MSDESKAPDPYEAALADLRAKRAEIDAAIETMERMRSLSRGTPPATGQAAPAVGPIRFGLLRTSTTHLPLSSPFYGKSLGEAAVHQIETAGKPQTPLEIWTALSAAGVQSAHNDPVHAVNNALVKQSRAKGELMLVGRGQWDLIKRYSTEELARIKENLGGMAGRDSERHRAKTREGMRAAAANGARIGSRMKLTADLVRDLKRLMAAGVSARKACKELGFSYGTYRNHMADIERWQDGQPWPPPPPTAPGATWDTPPDGRPN